MCESVILAAHVHVHWMGATIEQPPSVSVHQVYGGPRLQEVEMYAKSESHPMSCILD